MDAGKPEYSTVITPIFSYLKRNKIVLGIVLTVISTFLIILMNACAKLASPYHSVMEAVFYRNIFAMVVVLGYIVATKRWSAFKTKRPLAHLGRSIVGNIGLAMVFWAYTLMPMADVSALLFAAPLMITAMSALILREQVGLLRWGAVVIGFLGVSLIGLEQMGQRSELDVAHFAGFGVIVGLGAAFCVSLVSIFLRALSSTEDSFTTVFYFLLTGLVGSGIYMIFAGSMPHPAAIVPLFGAGVASSMSLLMKSQSYKYAEASLLSPYTYTAILWSALLGWLFWGELPTATLWIGAGIVIASNLFILYREQKKKQTPVPTDTVY